MNAEDEIRVSRDKPNILRVGRLICEGKISFKEVVDLIPKDEYLQQRASQVLIHTLAYHKYKPTDAEIVSLINVLKVEQMIDGAYRNILRTLEELNDYPEEMEGFLYDYCVRSIMDLRHPVAIRVFSIPVAFKIAKNYPELLIELKQTLASIPDEDSTSAITRKRKYLRMIEKELDNHLR